MMSAADILGPDLALADRGGRPPIPTIDASTPSKEDGGGSPSEPATKAAKPDPLRHEGRERSPETPERTCLGCRSKDARGALLRVVRSPDGRLAADVSARLGGRGAWVHPVRRCVETALKRGGFARTFRAEVSAEAGSLSNSAAEQYQRRVDGLLGSAHRIHKLAVGTDAVRDQLKSGSICALLVAEDAGNRREELWAAAETLGRSCMIYGTKASLGDLLGRPVVSVIGILETRLASEIATAVARSMALLEEA